MSRKYIDCREHSDSGSKCSVAISADSADEVVDAVMQHGIKSHGFKDTPDMRNQLKSSVKEGTPHA
jgi:predicted small metal-binding protein